MANDAGSIGSSDNKEVIISEKGAETFMVFDTGLEDEVIEDARKQLLEELGYELSNGSVNHGEMDGERMATILSIDHNHFGTFRHDRAEQVLRTITLALAKSQVSVEIVEAPKDFKQD